MLTIYVGRKARLKGKLCKVKSIQQSNLTRNRSLVVELEDGTSVKCKEFDLSPEYDKQSLYKEV